jgi:octaprenyl-diphosphate synthase
LGWCEAWIEARSEEEGADFLAIADVQQVSEQALPNGLAQLTALTREDLQAVNTIILERMQSEVALIPQLAGHVIAAGGKRLRPMLTLVSARLCGYQGRRHMALAACVEFIHTATLLHDDVVDHSHLRRGLETANSLWGNKASVLVGDFLFSRAFQVMVQDGSLEVLKILSDASAIIAQGEVAQLITANDMETSEADYVRVISEKTAPLFEAACRIGAVVGERPSAEQEALGRYGRNFGIAFQLVDDVLDYSARQADLGKTIGDDFREGKITLPVVLAFARGSEEERRFWCRCLEDLEQRDADLGRALGLMDRHGALDDSLDRARAYGNDAIDSLAVFEDSPYRRAMIEVVEFCIERAY